MEPILDANLCTIESHPLKGLYANNNTGQLQHWTIKIKFVIS